MRNRLSIDVPFEIKTLESDGRFSGYASVFNVKDRYSDVVVPGAFKKSLSDWAAKERMPALLWQHDAAQPIGIYEEMKEDDTGLYVSGRLLIDDVAQAKEAYALLKNGALNGMSKRYSIGDSGFEYDKENDVYLLKEIDLWEASIVTFPANDDARIQRVKSLLALEYDIPPKLVEAALRDAGFSVRQAKGLMANGYKGLRSRDVGAALDAFKNLNQKLQEIIYE
jgi:HK97 family phage prohead protease